MAQLSLRINGYPYSVGCEDGQESHLQAMAAEIEERVDRVKALGGQSGEARLLVLAALLMADELHDLTFEVKQLRQGIAPARDPELEARLDKLAIRAEGIAAQLDPA